MQYFFSLFFFARDLQTRKPYTITKQREKWTDEEHNRFLEALRLHGRAWQRIQEHIGTKSAVQIRSHAQKFFLKLEKGSGCMPSGHSHDIEIPPPRPKRKPYSSYPRKTGAASQNSSEEGKEKNLSKSFVLLSADRVVMDHKIKTFGEGIPPASTYFHSNDILERSQEQIPMMDELKEKRIRFTKELKKSNAELEIFGKNKNFTESHFGFTFSKDCIEDGQNHGNAAAQFESSKYSDEGISESFLAQLEANADLNLYLDSTRSATLRPKISAAMPSIDHAGPSVSLNNQLQNDENAFNALISLTNYFPNLLASALSQNPAVHQAASVAAALLPPMHSNFKLVGEGPVNQSCASSGISAIVTATVAAASAWWRVHGLLPSPFIANHALLRKLDVPQVHVDDSRNSLENVNQNHKQKSATPTQPCSALLEPSSSPGNCVNQAPGIKKNDPSSCDSNTSTSCEVEKDANLNKDETNRINELSEQPPSISQEFRDARNSKSCSNGLEEGPLAFQALFSPEKLSQNFSSRHLDNNLAFSSAKDDSFGLHIDLNRKLFTATTCNIAKETALNESSVATYKKHLVKTEDGNNTDQEESSTK